MFNRNKNRVERVIGELRRGMPVMLYDENNYSLFASIELLEQDLFHHYRSISNNLYITITASKIKHLYQHDECDNRRLLINRFDDVMDFMSSIHGDYKLECSRVIDKYSIFLLKLAELLPYALVIDMFFQNNYEMRCWCKKNDIIALNKLFIDEFQCNQDVYEVCRTSLFLRQNQKVNIISYRTYNSCKEHYAIIVGNFNTDEPLVRIHSSCYTGDLLDSLSCDCRDQLHQAMQIIANAGSGIILYLMQDGRGIGLANKLRAYSMQKKYNLDTVDANRVLGFDDDERNFTVAAKMLQKLNIKRLQLLTNNSRKLSELENSGIEVTRCVPLIIKHNEYNRSYIQTKHDRLDKLI